MTKSGHPNQVSKISQIRCQRQTQGSQCLPLNQCSQQDFSNSTPPYSCGFSNGEHQFCCVGDGPKLVMPQKPIFKQNGNEAWKCEDHTEMCQKWAKNHPNSCSDSNHSSYQFMKISCMSSCGFCSKDVIKVYLR